MNEEETKNTKKVKETKEKSKKIEETNETKQDNKSAEETAKKVKKNMVMIKIPVDPLNPKDLVVPVMINGYIWQIKRGETVEVPEAVANILTEAKYI